MEDARRFETFFRDIDFPERSVEDELFESQTHPQEHGELDTFDKFLKEVKKSTPLSEERLCELISARNEGDESVIQEIVEANLRLVLHFANKYAQSEEELQDLFQEGCIGLIKAARSFSLEKGCKFSTYATYWILETIQKARASSEKPVHITFSALLLLKKILRTQEEFYKEYGEEPSLEILSRLLDLPKEKITLLLSLDKYYSLERPVSDLETEETSALIQFIPNVEEDTESKVIAKLSSNCFDDAKKLLTEKEYTVLAYHYGLEGYEMLSFAKIGKILGLSRERIRQIEVRAFKKLRKNKRFVKQYGNYGLVSS